MMNICYYLHLFPFVVVQEEESVQMLKYKGTLVVKASEGKIFQNKNKKKKRKMRKKKIKINAYLAYIW